MKMTFGGHEFLLHPSGVLFWPEESLLVVADLHLEKGSHFAGRGYFLPPYDSVETLRRLHEAIKDVSARRILILGDCFHDVGGFSRLPSEAGSFFDSLRAYDPVWIIGNHDGDFVPEGMEGHDVYERRGILFRHEATPDGKFEISGHFHPKADIVHKGAIISRPCFIENGDKMILPSFGAYTGGLSVTHPSIVKIMGDDARLYIKGERKIYFFQAA
jgi:hypothetical protein